MPESERAKNGTVWASCAACNRNHKFGQCSQPAPAKEPTLTCSEVVERLRANIFNQEACEKILHSWRERRVQELEEQNKYLVGELSKRDKGLETLRGRIRELEKAGRSSVTDID